MTPTPGCTAKITGRHTSAKAAADCPACRTRFARDANQTSVAVPPPTQARGRHVVDLKDSAASAMRPEVPSPDGYFCFDATNEESRTYESFLVAEADLFTDQTRMKFRDELVIDPNRHLNVTAAAIVEGLGPRDDSEEARRRRLIIVRALIAESHGVDIAPDNDDAWDFVASVEDDYVASIGEATAALAVAVHGDL